MSDKEFIEHIAKEWIRLGGNAEGIHYLYWRIAERIDELLKENDRDSENRGSLL